MTTIRAGTSSDLPFLEAMLYEAFFWNAQSLRPPMLEAARLPEYSSLLADWGRPGDVARIAEHSGRPVGAAWFRLWSPELHSYGFVDEKTPELALAVQPSFRSQGIGRSLLRAAIAAAASAGHEGISLSVDPANLARRLYESAGFVKVGDVDTSWTMLLRLW
jgi:ribosomal protein S18 acetylase RimI-like enzyme